MLNNYYDFSPPPEPPPSVPADLETYTNITINNQTFVIEPDDLEVIEELGNNSFYFCLVYARLY